MAATLRYPSHEQFGTPLPKVAGDSSLRHPSAFPSHADPGFINPSQFFFGGLSGPTKVVSVPTKWPSKGEFTPGGPPPSERQLPT